MTIEIEQFNRIKGFSDRGCGKGEAEVPAEKNISRWAADAVKRGLLTRDGLDNSSFGSNPDLVWPASYQTAADSVFCLVRMGSSSALLVTGPETRRFTGSAWEAEGKRYLVCPLTSRNAKAVRVLLPFTAPSRILQEKTTFGMGDRLGLAAPGHIREISKYGCVPVFAQQSVRELELMGRTYTDLIDSATWAVLQEGYKGPWGADGDHLKTTVWVRKALQAGCTMITADLSDHIHSEYEQEGADVDSAYEQLPESYRKQKEKKFLRKTISLDTGDEITISKGLLKQIILVYKDAIDFAETLYNAGTEVCGSFDFEISIDETSCPTLPEAHVFVAEEIIDRGIPFQTIAPRFVGEFQKGIDYIGDMDEFALTFPKHAAIARHYGYKLSIHSGSDKFSVFPIIGRDSKGRFHVKTSGTHWLQSLFTAAKTNPQLFRRIYRYSLDVFHITRTYYHITPDLSNIDDINTVDDADLERCLNNVHTRQVLHVSYGEVYKNTELKKLLLGELKRHKSDYYEYLAGHLARHLNILGVEKK